MNTHQVPNEFWRIYEIVSILVNTVSYVFSEHKQLRKACVSVYWISALSLILTTAVLNLNQTTKDEETFD